MRLFFDSLAGFLRDADITGLAIVAAVLAFVGNKATADRPRVRAACWSVAGVAFLAYIGSYMVTGAYPGELSEVAVRGLLAALALAGVVSMLAPAAFAVFQGTIGATCGRLARWRRGLGDRWSRRRTEAMGKQQAEQQEESRRRKQAQSEEDNRIWKAAQLRRDEARSACEVLFATHAPELGKRFSREMFDEFLRKHMGDGQSPEFVEQRGVQLQGIVKSHLEKAGHSDRKTSLADLAAWFLKEKGEIERTALADDDKELLVAQLEERYVRLQEKYLRAVQL